MYETGQQLDLDLDLTEPISGNLLIKSPGIFKKYLNKPQATSETFNQDGWFITGDIAELDHTKNFKILGRSSTDIIKSGGYKISALQIEAKILEKNGDIVEEVAVIGMEDEDLGEIVLAVVVMKDGCGVSKDELNFGNLVNYQVPKKVVESSEPLPRNVMGKLNKKLIKNKLL